MGISKGGLRQEQTHRVPRLRLTGITSSDVGLGMEIVNAGVCRATFRAIDAAILPEDAIIVTINGRDAVPPT